MLKNALYGGSVDIDLLKSLAAVADTGSFSRAAKALCVSQSAVSKRIKLLEDSLNLPLLDRSGQVLQLTSAGKIVLKNAKAVLEMCDRCVEELNALKQNKKLSFCCTSSFGISHLPRIIRVFMGRNPGVTNFTFSLKNPDKILEGLQDDTFQIAVVEHCDNLPIQGNEIARLPNDRMLLVGAPALGINGADVSLANLLTCNICIRSVGCCSRSILENKMAVVGRSVAEFSRVLTYDDLNMLLNAILSGDGVGFLSSSVAAEYIADGRMTVYQVEGCEQTLYRSILIGSGFVHTPESDDLIRIIHEISDQIDTSLCR
jgi:DNA-binding transcriptional LysR family regulator